MGDRLRVGEPSGIMIMNNQPTRSVSVVGQLLSLLLLASVWVIRQSAACDIRTLLHLATIRKVATVHNMAQTCGGNSGVTGQNNYDLNSEYTAYTHCQRLLGVKVVWLFYTGVGLG